MIDSVLVSPGTGQLIRESLPGNPEVGVRFKFGHSRFGTLAVFEHPEMDDGAAFVGSDQDILIVRTLLDVGVYPRDIRRMDGSL